MTAETSNARGDVVAWFPTNGRGEIIRTYGDGSPVYACRTKEEAEQAKRCHLGATGPVIPLYAAPPPAVAEPKTLPVPTHVYLTDKAAVIVGDPQRGWGEEGPDAHNCDDMGCSAIGPHVLARVPFTVERPAAQQQQGQAVAWADEWRAAVAAKLSSYGLSEEAAAVFASSELDEYKAGLCDCAENDPVDMVDLMMGVARDAIEKWKIESAGRPFGHKNTAPPPSAPVVPDWITGDGMQGIKAEAHFLTQHTDETVQRVGRRLIERVDKIIAALAQQPAPPSAPVGVKGPLSVFSAGEWRYSETGQTFSAKDLDEAAFVVYRDHLAQHLSQAEASAKRLVEVLRNSADALERLAFAIRAPNAHTPQLVELAIAMRTAALAQQPAAPTLAKHQPCGCVICTCEDDYRCHGCGAKHCGNHTDHPPYVVQQPAAVDEAMVERAAAAVMSAPPGISVEAYVRIVLEAALAAQHQEPTT